MMFSVHLNATFKEKSDSDNAYKMMSLWLTFPAFQSATYKATGVSEVDDKVGEHPGFVDETWHDDQTLVRVMTALEDYGYNKESVSGIIDTLHNAGILFRERLPE